MKQKWMARLILIATIMMVMLSSATMVSASNESLYLSIDNALAGGSTTATISVTGTDNDMESFGLVLSFGSGTVLSLPVSNWFTRNASFVPSTQLWVMELNNFQSTTQKNIYISAFKPVGTFGTAGTITFNVSGQALTGDTQVISLSGQFFSRSTQTVKNFIPVSATFTVGTPGQQYVVSASVPGGHGAVLPGTQNVTSGGTASINIYVDDGYHIASITDNGVPVTPANPYVISNVTAAHAVVVTFSNLTSYTVTPQAGTGGTLSPDTPQVVDQGSTTAFTVSPLAGYRIGSVTGCGGALVGTTYTTAPITDACIVIASFITEETTNTLYGDFGASGIWKWDGSSWIQATPNSPDFMVTDGTYLYGSFTGGGIWKFDGSSWIQATPNNPEFMVTDGTDLYGSFTGGGIWKFDGSTWTQATPNNPQSMVTLGTDLYGSFTGGGIWKFDGTSWTQATPNNPDMMVTTTTTLYGSFTGGGIWKWDGSSWTQATPNNPELLIASGENLFGSFVGAGIWKWDGSTWTQVTPNNPQQMVASDTELYGYFNDAGIWKWDGTTWTLLAPSEPESMVVGE